MAVASPILAPSPLPRARARRTRASAASWSPVVFPFSCFGAIGTASKRPQNQVRQQYRHDWCLISATRGRSCCTALKTAHTPQRPTHPQLMLMMLARPAPKSTPEAITNSVWSDKDRRNKASWEHAKSSIFTAFSPFSKAIKKGTSSRDRHAKRGRPSAQSRSFTNVHTRPLKNAGRTGDEAGRRHWRHPGKAKALG